MFTKSQLLDDIANLDSKDFAEKYADVDVSSILESADMAIHTQIQKYQKGGVSAPVSKNEFGTQTHLAKLKLAAQDKNKINNRDNKYAVKRVHVGEDVEDIDENKPCWKKYEMVGMKKGKKGKEVPNCVPKEELDLDEATYKGKQVPLNKPMKGDVKKSKVYVDPDGDGKAQKVNFGDKTLSIKKDNPARKKSYCARSSGQGNLTDKTSANYWSRKAWDCNEETMTSSEKKERENIVSGMKKSKEDLKARYGKRWKDVMYATATKRAMGEEVTLDEMYQAIMELSANTLKSYVKKASRDISKHRGREVANFDATAPGANDPEGEKAYDKAFLKRVNRTQGISKAVDKL